MKEQIASNIMKGAAAGAVGGLAGAWSMSQFAGAFDRVVLKDKRRPFLIKGSRLAMNASPQEWDSSVRVANDVSQKIFGHKLSRRHRALGATAVHYAMGVSLGAAYGAAAEIAPATKAASGLAFGMALWLVAFEWLMPRLGFTRKRRDYTKAQHADSAGEHVVFGITTEMIRGVVREQL